MTGLAGTTYAMLKLSMARSLLLTLVAISIISTTAMEANSNNMNGSESASSASGTSNALKPGEITLELNKKDNGGIFSVRAGDVIRIELESLGAAGYGWYMEDVNPGLIEVLSEETSKVPSKAIGGPVTHLWTLKAKDKGVATFTLRYYRIWEGPKESSESASSASKRFSIKLNIR